MKIYEQIKVFSPTTTTPLQTKLSKPFKNFWVREREKIIFLQFMLFNFRDKREKGKKSEHFIWYFSLVWSVSLLLILFDFFCPFSQSKSISDKLHLYCKSKTKGFWIYFVFDFRNWCFFNVHHLSFLEKFDSTWNLIQCMLIFLLLFRAKLMWLSTWLRSTC